MNHSIPAVASYRSESHDPSGQAKPAPVVFNCADGIELHGDLWGGPGTGAVVIVNPATGVLARYYHRYAAYLASQGFSVITYDYRGIGRSRPKSLRKTGFRWSDWGTLDFAAVLDFACEMAAGRPVMVVGHSIGGFLPGLAPGFERCSAMLTVGAQFAYWQDYAPHKRLAFFLKWHVAMPLLASLFGYFPGRALGWLEDLPAGVAYEWAFRRAKVERSFPAAQRQPILNRLAAFGGPLQAVTAEDDPYGSPQAVSRSLSYYTRAQKNLIVIAPADLGVSAIGHFDLFHAKHQGRFWTQTAGWLARKGREPLHIAPPSPRGLS